MDVPDWELCEAIYEELTPEERARTSPESVADVMHARERLFSRHRLAARIREMGEQG